MGLLILTARKGGAGKTALATSIAASLMFGPNGVRSRRVLLIDLDVQADASAILGVISTGEVLRDALRGRIPIGDAIVETQHGIHLAPSGEAIGTLCATAAPDAVRLAIESLPARSYDWIVIDCGPATDRLTASAWAAGGTLVVPVDGPSGLHAATRLQQALEDLRIGADRMRLVITRHDRRRLLDQAVLAQVRRAFGDSVAQATVRETTNFGQAAACRTPLPLLLPNAPAVADLHAVTREVSR